MRNMNRPEDVYADDTQDKFDYEENDLDYKDPNGTISDTVLEQMLGYAKEDIREIFKSVKADEDIDLKYIGIDWDVYEDDQEVTYVFTVIDKNNSDIKFKFILSYVLDDNDIYLKGSIDYLIKAMLDDYYIANDDWNGNEGTEGGEDQEVKSSISIKKKRRIVAAVEDEEDIDIDDIDMGDDANSDEIEDSLDEIEDTVDDLQESINNDVDEDEPSIEVDNNIANHYIVECKRCKGIFISALIESDAEVDSISGICPLCNKESDQIVKWVVKDVNSK